MKNLTEIIKELILRKEQGKQPITLLAVCPNSSSVLEAAVKAASRNRSVMLLAATLNQVDFEASYTGWTPDEFVREMQKYAQKYDWQGPIYPCLDHGGPWLKDLHTLAKLSYRETMDKVKTSISACIQAGYKLLHIDPTVDRTLPEGNPLPLELVVQRTVELMEHAEMVRDASGSSKLDYEVGTEEVHGGLVDIQRFESFVELLQKELAKKNLSQCWPCLLVAQVGTDLHTTTFRIQAAQRLYSILAPLGSLVKGHYTDWVDAPQNYPAVGMGAANVGPEFTAAEYDALGDMEAQELSGIAPESASHFMGTLQAAVIESGRWKKWLFADEKGLPFTELTASRKDWLLKTGARYIWTDPRVITARKDLYHNLNHMGVDAHAQVVESITQVIEKYVRAFNLSDSAELFGGE